jgi:hypothetical protein
LVEEEIAAVPTGLDRHPDPFARLPFASQQSRLRHGKQIIALLGSGMRIGDDSSTEPGGLQPRISLERESSEPLPKTPDRLTSTSFAGFG